MAETLLSIVQTHCPMKGYLVSSRWSCQVGTWSTHINHVLSNAYSFKAHVCSETQWALKCCGGFMISIEQGGGSLVQGNNCIGCKFRAPVNAGMDLEAIHFEFLVACTQKGRGAHYYYLLQRRAVMQHEKHSLLSMCQRAIASVTSQVLLCRIHSCLAITAEGSCWRKASSTSVRVARTATYVRALCTCL